MNNNDCQTEAQNFSAALARRIIDAGISVLPIETDGQKSPMLTGMVDDKGKPIRRSWKAYQSKAMSPGQVTHEFSCGDEGAGIIGGAISGNFEILDFERVLSGAN